MNLSRRLERLEANAPGTESRHQQGTPRHIKRYFDAIARHRREEAGLPVEDLPYTKEDYEDDLDTLERIIPRMREARGWQSGEAREFLDTWEDTTRKKLESCRKETANE